MQVLVDRRLVSVSHQSEDRHRDLEEEDHQEDHHQDSQVLRQVFSHHRVLEEEEDRHLGLAGDRRVDAQAWEGNNLIYVPMSSAYHFKKKAAALLANVTGTDAGKSAKWSHAHIFQVSGSV